MSEATGWARSLATLTRLPALAVLDRIPVPVVAVDAGCVIVYANPAFGAMLGRGEEHFGGELLGALLRAPGSIPDSCAELADRAGSVLRFVHAENFDVRARLSESAVLHGFDGGCMFAFDDVTEQAWEGWAAP